MWSKENYGKLQRSQQSQKIYQIKKCIPKLITINKQLTVMNIDILQTCEN